MAAATSPDTPSASSATAPIASATIGGVRRHRARARREPVLPRGRHEMHESRQQRARGCMRCGQPAEHPERVAELRHRAPADQRRHQKRRRAVGADAAVAHDLELLLARPARRQNRPPRPTARPRAGSRSSASPCRAPAPPPPPATGRPHSPAHARCSPPPPPRRRPAARPRSPAPACGRENRIAGSGSRVKKTRQSAMSSAIRRGVMRQPSRSHGRTSR